jgi:dimethylargininase
MSDLQPPTPHGTPPGNTLVALTREVSATIAQCELTHRDRTPIDAEVARQQHTAYEDALRSVGCCVERIPAAPELPDAVFVEDTALVFDEVAVMTRPGAESRRGELPPVERAVARYRDVARIDGPGTLDGGDVLVVGDCVFVGCSSRTNTAGIDQLRALLCPFGYRVEAAPVYGCLHLKSAVTAIGPQTLLINRAWTSADTFREYDLVDVHPFEPFAANALLVNDGLIFPAEFPRTAERLERRDLRLHTVPAAELAKAEGGVTCCSILVR